jgi:hypothetical protein
MNRFVLTTACLATLLPSSAAIASSGDGIGYFLPETEVDIVVSQRIASCPGGDDKIEVVTDISIEPTPVPGPFVNVDVRSGLFAERSTKLVLRPNGTLEAFNAESHGQGGKILGAIAKTALSVASSGALFSMAEGNKYAALTAMMFDPDAAGATETPSAGPLLCKKAVSNALASIVARQAEIKTIEKRMVTDGGKPGDEELLERRRTQIAKLKEALTLTSDATIDPSGQLEKIAAVDYLEWFEPNANLPEALKNNNVMGRSGFKIEVKADPGVRKHVGSGDGTQIKPLARRLVYKRPVPTQILVKPCSDDKLLLQKSGDDGKRASQCAADSSPEAKAIYAADIVPVSQFSGFYSLRVGDGGLFGSREAGAKFDEFGTPLELEYGTSTGTDDAAGVISASGEGFLSARDSEINALERQIKVAKARKELAELRAGVEEEDD